MMKKLDKATRILAKLVEVGHWIAAAAMVVVMMLSLFMGAGVVQNVDLADFGASLTTYGFDVMIINGAGQVDLAALRLFCVGAAFILGLMAMVFRNIYLILKKSEHTTPFQKDNVRMVREIGIFLLSVPIVGLIMSGVARLVIDPGLVATSVGLDSFMVGLAVLCLSQFFARGVDLEAETEGLL